MNRIESVQKAAAARTLATAFHDDPVVVTIAPDPERRARVGRWFFGTAVEYGLRWGQVWADPDVSAVAVWLPPGSTSMTMGRMLRAGLARMPVVAGPRATGRFLRGSWAWDEVHTSVSGPHWYLVAIGTLPDRQGQGLGNALVKVGTDQADAAGLPCYLETATDDDIAFYRRRGFRVAKQVTVHGFTLTGMVRDPQAEGSLD